MTAAKLVLEGQWAGKGVKTPEDKSLDSKVFLQAMAENGLSWTVKNLPALPAALKKEY